MNTYGVGHKENSKYIFPHEFSNHLYNCRSPLPRIRSSAFRTYKKSYIAGIRAKGIAVLCPKTSTSHRRSWSVQLEMCTCEEFVNLIFVVPCIMLYIGEKSKAIANKKTQMLHLVGLISRICKCSPRNFSTNGQNMNCCPWTTNTETNILCAEQPAVTISNTNNQLHSTITVY
jgi:ribosome modulation factor